MIFRGILLLGFTFAAFAEDAVVPSYTRDIRPILAENCFKCHGPDENTRAAKLRLDTFEGAIAEARGGGPIVSPGDPDDSTFMERILTEDEDELMPPPATGKKLDDAQKEKLRDWIAAGAKYEPHWSFARIERPELPAVRDAAWPRNAIDFFVLARLEQEGLTPSPEADRATLLRRVSLDLTGLPPSPEELKVFLQDSAPDAYERAVDRLLELPHYGERWARLWLDLARYADTQGYEKDAKRTIWRYRDWVIDAFNQDMPFDQFTIEQLAGDLMPDAKSDHLLATAFHRNTMTNTEGGTDNEEFRTAAVIDRVNTTSTVWLGLTMSCVQCHTHKYDPITHREYYQFYDFFNQTADADRDDETPIAFTPTAPQALVMARHDAALVQAVDEVRRAHEGFDTAFAAWEKRLRASLAASPAAKPWHVLGPFETKSRAEGHAEAFIDEGTPVDLNARPHEQRWKLRKRLEDKQTNTLEGAGVVYYLQRTVNAKEDIDAELRLFVRAGAKLWLNGELLFDDARANTMSNPRTITAPLRQGDNEVLLKLTAGNRPAEFRLETRTLTAPAELVTLLPIEAGKRTSAESAAMAATFIAGAPEYESARPTVTDAAAKRSAYLAKVPTTPVMRALPDAERRTTYIFDRGNFLTPLEETVTADVPSVLPPMKPHLTRDRLGLAQWLTDRENPLTARVIANRYWETFFGTGIVDTPEDFGIQGSLPTHPELLDWLASEFMDSGWRMKALCKTIVTSAAYRQQSATTPELRERDPANRLVARGPRFRLEAETLRDQALAVSGLLSARIGGPSVMPPQPEGVWQVVYSGDSWTTSGGRDRYRRGIYTFWRRTSPYPSMVSFDAPSREICAATRIRTNTPLQALVTLNDPVYIEAAQALAKKICAAKPGTPEDGIAIAYEQALLRAPQPAETQRLAQLYMDTRAHFAAQPDAAVQLAGDDESAGDLAAWTAVCNVVLNLDEFLTKR